ncbi:hypothetical protein KO561_04405 [Radiobacillus kanasensis]|uniref:hypothetical protein n=1 Tax=Radiobacillus kanasensis TaxID=2844358 RepID=UPI001E3BDB3C|nr:hypothetical protein [Radiobacillus kanasensis]UFU00198.1 hypothetical protein KO561_04405 [Radiobacillus kanasensis]
MNELAKKLQPFIVGSPHIEILKDDFSHQIVDVKSGQVYGFVHLNEGRLIAYEISEPEEVEDEQIPFNTPPNVDRIMEVAQLFIDTFINRDVHFSMLNEWNDNHFMVTYEERDPKLDLLIPHTGCTLHFTRDGILTNADIGQMDFQLLYPEITVSSEDAKQLLRKANYLQLSVHVPDLVEMETNPVVELIYRSNHNIMGVGADGNIETVTEFMNTEELSIEKIQAVNSTSSIEEMLGVNKKLEKNTGEDGSVIWIDPTVYMEEDEEAEPLISIFSDETGHFSFSNLPFEKMDDTPSLPMGKLTEKALEFLELVEGNIHDKYVLEEPIKTVDNEELFDEEERDEAFENELDAEDEEDMAHDYLDSEPTQMFTFYRQHGEFRMESVEAHVHVGIYTGLIRECSVTRLSSSQTANLEKLNPIPTITLQEAEERFFNELEMKLTRCVKDFGDPNIYTLSYLVDFPKTGGHIEKINAHTGEVSYIETGIIKERH